MKISFAKLLATLAIGLLCVPANADDEAIAKMIAQRLQAQQASAKLTDFNIGIQVDKGTVTMMGEVANSTQATTALDIARRVPGVKLVVNDLHLKQTQAVTQTPQPAVQQTGIQQVSNQLVAPPTPAAVGAGVTAPALATTSILPTQPTATEVAAPQPVPTQPVPTQAVSTQTVQVAPKSTAPRAFAPSQLARGLGQQGMVRPVQYSQSEGVAPIPMSNVPSGIAQSNYDQPQMPGYAWPSYAAHPNYGALTYPQQYSPTAWPYIGPFYPYPQVPLGWRKVTLEWDDGWWFLDFKSK